MKIDLLKQMRSTNFESYAYDSLYIDQGIFEKLQTITAELRTELEAQLALSPQAYDRKLGVLPLSDWLQTVEGRAASIEAAKLTRTYGSSKVNEFIWGKYFKDFPHAKRKPGMPKGGGRVPSIRYVMGWLISVALKNGWSVDQLYDEINQARKELIAA